MSAKSRLTSRCDVANCGREELHHFLPVLLRCMLPLFSIMTQWLWHIHDFHWLVSFKNTLYNLLTAHRRPPLKQPIMTVIISLGHTPKQFFILPSDLFLDRTNDRTPKEAQASMMHTEHQEKLPCRRYSGHIPWCRYALFAPGDTSARPCLEIPSREILAQEIPQIFAIFSAKIE